MLFTSIHFLIFFPIVVALYFSIKYKYRWILLLVSSYYFYMSWKAEYVILLLISTFVVYFSALYMDRVKSLAKRRFFLGLSLFTNLGLLFAFKYFNFFSDSLRDFLRLFSIQFPSLALNVLLPLGISFYTFQSLSYAIDVYNKKIKPEKHIGIFAVYVSFFPQLVAGPIERAGNLLPQFFEKHSFNYKQATGGLKLMLWGFFKKIVVAERLAIVVNAVYSNPTDYTGVPLILATVFFAFQIYYDFSAYSDIAVGAAQVMGFRLMDNFKRPYSSRSLREFWRRWHISLSSWFRDYVYIPLGGNRVKVSRLYVNLSIVFLLAGLWHGADWTFIFWGALHGFYLVFSLITKNIRGKVNARIGLTRFPKIHMFFQILVTFILVNIGWIFFRANSFSDAIYIFIHMFSGWGLGFSGIFLGSMGMRNLIPASILIVFVWFVHMLQGHKGMRQFLSDKPTLVRWSVYLVIIFAIILFGVFEAKEFIYFQF